MPRTAAADSQAIELRRALAALALGGFAIGTAEFVVMGLLPEIARGIGVSVPDGSHAISAYALGVVVGAPVVAGLAARYPRRAVLVWLMAAYMVSNILSALAPSYNALVATRFVAGVPHGAYFGVAALVAVELAGPERRAWAVARVFLGLTIATVVGAPAATWLGQSIGWRSAFAAVAVLAALTAVVILRFVPFAPPDRAATFQRELGALRRPQVLLAVATGAIGGGGLFAVYSYLSPILTQRTGLPISLVPVALVIVGLGMVAGNLLGARLVDWQPVRATFIGFLGVSCVCAAFAITSTMPALALANAFLLGFFLIVPTAMQTRLMDVAGDAQTLGATLNSSAFNIANALGAWLGGVALAAGLGLTAPMWIAVGLTLAGMSIYALALALERSNPT